MVSYSQKLQDPRWEDLRRKAYLRDDGLCQNCGQCNGAPHVHHKYYIHGRQPWEYPLCSLITLCDACHTAIHANSRALLPFERVLAALEGMMPNEVVAAEFAQRLESFMQRHNDLAGLCKLSSLLNE
jgi:hypothetical protein